MKGRLRGSVTIIKRHRKYHHHKEPHEVSQSLRDTGKFYNHREAQGSFTIREAPGNDTLTKMSQGVLQLYRRPWNVHNRGVIGPGHFGPGRFATERFGPGRFVP